MAKTSHLWGFFFYRDTYMIPVLIKELLEKAYEFMKQFGIDGVNLLERFLESVGKVIGNVYKKTK